MTTHSWQAPLVRWGDPVFRLALLLADDHTAAEQTTVRAFTRVLGAAPADVETALYDALLARRSRYERFRSAWRRRHALPRALRRVPALERTLLGLWLLRDVSGSRLVTLSGLPAPTLAPRLTAALLPLLDRADPVRTDPARRAAFTTWLSQQLGLTSPTGEPSTTDSAWPKLLEDTRLLLLQAVGRQRLPLRCVDEIAAHLHEQRDSETLAWWQQRWTWIAAPVLGTLLVLALLLGTGQNSALPATASLPPARAIVEQTLNAWTTTPVSNTLYRRIETADPRMRPGVTYRVDLWLAANSARHRMEVRRADRLIEWQIGDGNARLDYAGWSTNGSCPWIFDGRILDGTGRTFPASAAEQQLARDARLTLGPYGIGYQALQHALIANDLRSLGTRQDGERSLLMLSFTDRQATPARKLLLWVDPVAGELHAVQELADAGTQSAPRDLWRVQQQETRNDPISLTPPSWRRAMVTRSRLFDPTCPALDPDRVVSLRTIVGVNNGGPWGWYLPKTLPPGVDRAVLLSHSTVTSNSMQRADGTPAIYVGPNHWLSIATNMRPAYDDGESLQRSEWRVTVLEDARPGVLRATLCRQPNNVQFCAPTLDMLARGWTQDELLAIIDTLAPVDTETWLTQHQYFLDPHPLPTPVQTILGTTFKTIQPQDGTLHSVVDEQIRIDPERRVWRDPYHVPLADVYPERLRTQQWLEYTGGRLERFKQIRTLPGGTLLRAEVNDTVWHSEYEIAQGIVEQEYVNNRWWTAGLQSASTMMVLPLISTTAPLTLTEQADTWLLEQADSHFETQRFRRNYLPPRTPWLDDLTGQTFIRRVWIDRATSRPQKTEVLHVDHAGRETHVLSQTLTESRYLDSPPTGDFFALPELPPDTVRFENRFTEPPVIVDTELDFTPPSRALIWPEAAGSAQEADRNPDESAYATANTIRHAFFTYIHNNDTSGLFKVTRYRLPPNNALVIVRQGPRDLLRHILRYQSREMVGPNLAWKSSKPVSVTIDGRQHTAWLLEGYMSPALVVEVDDVLLHISTPDIADLNESLLQALSKLEWQPITGQIPTGQAIMDSGAFP